MMSIPGKIEESTEFVDSAILTQETEWMDNSFLSPQRRRASSYLGPRLSLKGRDRPCSAPRERLARDFMSSTPNLTLSSTSDPGPLDPHLSTPGKWKYSIFEEGGVKNTFMLGHAYFSITTPISLHH